MDGVVIEVRCAEPLGGGLPVLLERLVAVEGGARVELEFEVLAARDETIEGRTVRLIETARLLGLVVQAPDVIEGHRVLGNALERTRTGWLG